MKAKGKEVSEEDKNKLLEEIKETYNSKLSPYYAASQLWVDHIIDPLDTRRYVSQSIEAANHSPIDKKFNVGVIQT
jgi:acetyl-CoA carboxylase carboxyltransferase component